MRKGNASDWFADLIKELQLGRVELKLDQHKKPIKFAPKVDVTAPVFDASELFLSNSPLGRPDGRLLMEYRKEVVDRVNASQLHLPYAACWFCIVDDQYEKGTDVINMIYVEQYEDMSLKACMFALLPNKPWRVAPAIVHAVAGSYTCSFIALSSEVPDDVINMAGGAAAQLLADCAIVCILLEEPRAVKAIKLDAGPALTKIIARRHKNHQPSLGGISVIKLLDSVPFPSPVKIQPGQGTPKRPHTRRGHLRHFKSGKNVWIGPIKIHGGDTMHKVYEIKV